MRYKPVLQSTSLVLVGNFNPAIFSPAWFVLHDLIPDFNPEDAQVKIIHGAYTEVLAGNMKLTVQPDRFSLDTQDEPFVKILDVILGTFGNALPHTPIRLVGINYHLHFALDSGKQRLALGRALSPLAPWGDWGGTIDSESDDLAKAGGLRSLVVEEAVPDGRDKGGYRRAQIEPSVRQDFLDPYAGVYMAVNDHYVIEPDPEKPGDASRAMSILNDKFDHSLNVAKSIVSGIMDFASTLR